MNEARNKKYILATAWAAILTISLYKIILQEIFQVQVPADLQSGIEVSIVIAGFVLTFAWKTIHPLRPFFGLFIVLVCAQWLVYNRIDQLPIYRTWLSTPSFNFMVAEKSLGLMVAFIILAYLFLLKKKRQLFYLARGDMAAPVEPVKWLGIKAGVKWDKLGRDFAFILSLGTLAFLMIAGHPPLSSLVKAVPFLPAVLLAAAMNAFYEEITYKAGFLAVLVESVGKQPALWLLAAYFGFLHYYGVPYGIIGVLMAGFLGWFLAKSMIETGGLFWAWFLHFLQDVLIFAFMAIGSITPGG